MSRPRDALPEGIKLAGYVIGDVLGRGGFGITYLAHDALFPDTKVAIKEFFPAWHAVRDPGGITVHPTGLADDAEYAQALSRFEAEARTLVALRHPCIVEVQRYIEANGTAYVVMKYEEGRPLDWLLEGGKTLSAEELGELIPPLLDGLEAVHARNFLHRDIKPSNIYIRAAGGLPVLLDFGTARVAIGADRETSFTQHLTPGYAPFEQYLRKGNQGPWTDIHALGATLYRCVTGRRPPDAPDRVSGDELVPAREIGRGRYPDALLAAVDAMLAVDEKKRPQSIGEVRALLAAKPAPAEATATLVAGARSEPQVPVSLSPPVMPSKPLNLEWPSPAPAKARWDIDDGEPRPPPPEAGSRRGLLLALAVAAALAIVYLLFRTGPPDSAPQPAVAGAPEACRAGSGWRAGCVFRDCPECPEMVVVPAGTFLMGSVTDEDWRATYVGAPPAPSPMFSLLKYESPQRRVSIARPFAMARYETKFSEYDACHAAGACAHRPNDKGWGREQRPVIDVSHDDARKYIEWLSSKTGRTYRLPSEAEWEYAARAGSTTRFFWGDDPGQGRANCWGCGSPWDRQSSPVGSFAPNAFGLHDMHGNVWEAVEDCWNENYNGAPSDGSAWLTGLCARRVVRGGGYDNHPGAIRSAVRVSNDSRGDMTGFRAVRQLD